MEMIKINYNGKDYEYEKNTPLIYITKDLYENPKKVLAVFLDNELFSLDKDAIRDCVINFVTIEDHYGSIIYQKALIFVLVYAFKELFGYGYHVNVWHSLDKGIRIKTDLPLNMDRLSMIKDKMREIIDEDMLITKCLVRRREAIKYFESIGDDVKAATFRYSTNHYVTLYKLGDMYDYFFSNLPRSTGVLQEFDLHYLDDESFVLQFPTVIFSDKIPEYIDRPKIMKVFDFNYEESKRLGIFNVSDLNQLVSSGNISDIVLLTETIASHELLIVAKTIIDKGNVKMVLLAGPSSSGKTTTARKLSMYLKAFGLNPKPLSMDDYFKSRDKTPLMENGKPDFESSEALDIDLFNDHVKKIINGEEVSIPTYNFYKGEPEYLGKKIKLEENDILIVEGLHAINEELTKEIEKDRKFKIYVSPFSNLNIDNHNPVSNTDLRLLRRIVRDNRTRGYSAEHTIAAWRDVRFGEEKYVFPYQEDADYVYNTSLVYEVGVLKLFVEPLLFGIDKSSPYYERVVELLRFLDKFVGIPTDDIPSESILREFIGGSYFE